MMHVAKKLVSTAMAVLMVMMLAGSANLVAGEHVVKRADLHKRLLQQSEQKNSDLAAVRAFFGSETALKAFAGAGLSPDRVDRAVAALDSGELAQLAARVDKVQKDFAGGALTNQQITYILIALATAVVILVIVAAD